jgi:ribosomal protein S14
MSDQVQPSIASQIEALVAAKNADGEYVTVRFAAKQLGIKQTDVRPNLPEGATLLPSKNGTLGEFQIKLSTGEEEEYVDVDDVDTLPSTDSSSEEEVVQVMLPRKTRRVKVETEPKVQELDEEGNPIPEAEKVICVVCGNPVRRNTIVRRGICPLCFRQLAKNVGFNATKLEGLTDEEFEIVVGEELSKRRSLEEYKASRTLNDEQVKQLTITIIPVKQVFAAAKAAGYGPGRVAQAMGGDRFRHDPLGGRGSVWTPYFVGARKGWFFDEDILNHFDDLAKPVKEKKAKTAGSRATGAGRKGARGAAMTPVEDGDGEGMVMAQGIAPTEEDELYEEEQDEEYSDEELV